MQPYSLLGRDPSIDNNVENIGPANRPHGYEAAKNSLIYACIRRQIGGHFAAHQDEDCDQDPVDRSGIRMDLYSSTVLVDELIVWLKKRGMRTGFFFPEGKNIPDYLDPTHPRYAPKLAAAIQAWTAMEDITSFKGTPKQAMAKWLRLNSTKFGLADEDGKLSETAIEECAKVANWQEKGGAPKTL